MKRIITNFVLVTRHWKLVTFHSVSILPLEQHAE